MTKIIYKGKTTEIRFSKTPDRIVISRLLELNFIPTDKNYRVYEKLNFSLPESFLDYLENLLALEGEHVARYSLSGLAMPYIPASEQGNILNVVTPDSMGYEMHIAVRKIKAELGKDLFTYVREKLDFTPVQLIKALYAEQVDAVALAIYNIENKKQGMIIADQTGIGKGRVAASMIRYGVKMGLKPIFLSEKPNLFTDIYRDLVGIGSPELVPFIVNGREAKTHIKDENGEIVHQAPEAIEQNKILASQKLPAKYDFICATYSQFNQPDKKPVKPLFFEKMAIDNIVVMDESHNASGSSNTGAFLQNVLAQTRGVTFLSATFAKRPDNMPIYAKKTAMADACLSNEDLVEAISNGGVALQEVLSSQLVSEGQLIRRERPFEGIEVNYNILNNQKEAFAAISDRITGIIRDIIKFEEDYISKEIASRDEALKAEQSTAEKRKGTVNAGVDNTPYFSKVFNVVNQLLFSIKADAVAEKAIQRLKEGKKPVIAFSSTMGSFLADMGGNEDVINADFTAVLRKGLENVLKYSEKDGAGNSIKKMLSIAELGNDALKEYNSILEKIEAASSGISISPIDVIKQRLELAGYKVAEVTGRTQELKFPVKNGKLSLSSGTILNRKKENATDAFRKFNNNEVDVLMINQSGSTGASAHAIVTDKVPASEVKQRVMIMLQAELNINTEVQKRGRINRTGQIMLPIYDYQISPIPAELRLLMMLRKKLKSLDANTTSNQRASDDIVNVDDFLNKIGDKVVTQYLIDNPELNDAIGNPLDSDESTTVQEGAASKVSGRIAVLKVVEQDKFYAEVSDLYAKEVEYLKMQGKYDLEMEILNLQAETVERKVVKAGTGGGTIFGHDVVMEKASCNVLSKPFTKTELDNLLANATGEKDPAAIQKELIQSLIDFEAKRVREDHANIEIKFAKLTDQLVFEPKYKKLTDKEDQKNYIAVRRQEIAGGKKEAIDLVRKQSDSRVNYVRNFFSFFKNGQACRFPSVATGETSPAVFLEFRIDPRKANPFAPSAVEAIFAVADSRKMIKCVLSGSQGDDVSKAISQSFRLSEYERRQIIERWEDLTKEAMKDRSIRYIMTGNILMAAGEYDSGKLVSYSTLLGTTEKGILMPAAWSPRDDKSDSTVIVPLSKAIKYVAGIAKDSMALLDSDVAVYHKWNGTFNILVPKAGSNKPIYTDQDLVKLGSDSQGFILRGGNFILNIEPENIVQFLTLFASKYNASVKVSRSIFDQTFSGSSSMNRLDKDTREAIELFEKDKQHFESRKNQQGDNAHKLKLAKAKAQALKLKLKLLALKTVNS